MNRPTTATERYRTPPPLVRRNTLLLVATIAATFIALRIWLHAAPNSDFDVGGYNIHHLFTGVLLITAGGVPLAVFRGSTRRLDLALVCFGAGLGMALDEWVFLVATGGSNAEYLLPVSFWGGVLVVGASCAYAVALAAGRARQVRSGRQGR
jgi:hypothetical protein